MEQNVDGNLDNANIIISPTHTGKVTVNYSPDVEKLQQKLNQENNDFSQEKYNKCSVTTTF